MKIKGNEKYEFYSTVAATMRHFNGLSAAGGEYASIFFQIGQTAAKIWRFNCSQNGGRPASAILDL